MFSYLRPHHKRTPSNPTSPADPSQHSFEPPLHPNSPLDHGHPQRFQDVDPKGSSTSLPSNVRVSSADADLDNSRRRGYEGEPRNQHWDALRNSTRPHEINTHTNHQRITQHTGGTTRLDSGETRTGSNHTNGQYPKPQSGLIQDRSKPTASTPGFGAVTDTQNKSMQNGRRATGARLSTPPPSGNQVSTFEPVQPKSGKTRLNLLNPMSLLARRRTSQAVPQLQPEALISHRTGNETYDFQIKGKFVHDFSAPRAPRRNVSYTDARMSDNSTSTQYPRSPNTQYLQTGIAEDGQISPWGGGNHTPVFTENFEEEQYPAAGPHVRKANDLTDLTIPRPPYAEETRRAANPTQESKDVEGSVEEHSRKHGSRELAPEVGPQVPPKNEGQLSSARNRISVDRLSTPPRSATSPKKGRARNVSEVSIKDVLPKHMKSTSSRFSFDMIGAAEQERLLEDRHRQRALERKNQDLEERADDEFDDEYNYDDMMDDDGLEERIPGVNTELEEEDDFYDDGGYEEQIPGVNADMLEDDIEEEIPGTQNLGDFSFQQPSAPMSPFSPIVVTTPRDAHGEVIGFAMTKESPSIEESIGTQGTPKVLEGLESQIHSRGSHLQGLALQGVDIQHTHQAEVSVAHPLTEQELGAFPQAQGLDDDDLYFDDGIIGGHIDSEDAAEFDESVFDNVDTDQYGRPIRSLSSLPTLYSPPMLTADPSPSLNKPDPAATGHEYNTSSVIATTTSIGPRPSVTFQENPLAQNQGLTQDSLAAYQSALAAAAHIAAAAGKFRRDSTSTFQPISEQVHEDSQPGLIPDSSQASHNDAFSPNYEFEDDFDYDDALEDDAIIAAANAEALANDADGFYGQEFGFYSAPAGQAEFANGGYFGPRGVEGINRSLSGRIASREPNLTPITERSEYSNRNSFMGFSMNRAESLASPGLAQLAGMMRREDYEGDLSLDALLKLRRGAWGGSQASLHSSAGSPRSAGVDEGSPVGGIPPWSAGGQSFSAMGPQGYMRRNSGFSGASMVSDTSMNAGSNTGIAYTRRNSTGMAMEIGPTSEDSSSPASPTFNRPSPPTAPEPALVTSQYVTSPVPATGAPISKGGSNEGRLRDKDRLRKHRYTTSADSISYSKEEDSLSGDRWVVERKRTAESGEVEVLGREVVSGGRI